MGLSPDAIVRTRRYAEKRVWCENGERLRRGGRERGMRGGVVRSCEDSYGFS
jgi:hypothetical protein